LLKKGNKKPPTNREGGDGGLENNHQRGGEPHLLRKKTRKNQRRGKRSRSAVRGWFFKVVTSRSQEKTHGSRGQKGKKHRGEHLDHHRCRQRRRVGWGTPGTAGKREGKGKKGTEHDSRDGGNQEKEKRGKKVGRKKRPQPPTKRLPRNRRELKTGAKKGKSGRQPGE